MSQARPLRATGSAKLSGAVITVPTGSHRLIVSPLAPGLLELRLESDAPLPASPAALPFEEDAPEPKLEETPGAFRMAMPDLIVSIGRDPLTLTLETRANETLWGPVAFGIDRGKLVLSGPLRADDAFYGLGEKPGYLDKRGRRYGMWTTDNIGPHNETDDLLYQAIPFLITRHKGRACGLLFDDPGRTRYDLGLDDPDAWRFVADGPGLRFYVAAGPDLHDVIARYTQLTGRMPMPPRWAIGYHQSRWGYQDAEAIRDIASQFRVRRIPCDVIHLDIDYMDAYRVFTWHPGRHPDPEALMTELGELGFKAVTIVDPGVKKDPGYGPYDELKTQGLYVRDKEGDPFVGEVWPGPCLFPDFLREETRQWWGARHHALTDVGVAGIWNDMNEPSVFRGPMVSRPDQTMPDDAQHGAPESPVPHRQVHNLYGFYMSQATREGLAQLQPDKRPFVITRSGYAGIQRHAMVWTGDNHAAWSHLEQSLPMCLNLGLSGVAFCGPDVGGFSGDTTAELLIRWTQAGALMPFFRNHSAHDTRRQEPWTFGATAETLCRQAIELRYRLMPYLYTLFHDAARSGLPIMRPMILGFADDPACARLFDQYMLGPDVLVAPVVRPGATHRMVYFPAARWVCFHTGRTIEGPGHHVVDAPLDRLPLFVREGTVLPMGPVVQHTGEPLETLTLLVAPGRRIFGTWYDDDGESLGYQEGRYNLWRFSGRMADSEWRLSLSTDHAGYASPTQAVRVVLPLDREPRGVSFNGEAVTGTVTDEGLRLDLPLRTGELVVLLD